MNRAIIILGPTSTGKTDLGIYLSKKFSGEIISADSRQVYIGLDIGTGKVPNQSSKFKVQKFKGLWKINNIKIYCLDVATPKKQYSVKNFVDDAKDALGKIEKVNKLPIIVGGTGLYIKALTEGFESLSTPKNLKLRKELEGLSLEDLQEKLKKISPEKWSLMNNSDRQNKRRLIRVLEVVYMYGYTKKTQSSNVKFQNYEYLKIGLIAPTKVLREKIRKRVDLRFKQGLITEAKNLKRNGLAIERMKELGLDYKLLAGFLEGEIDEKHLREKIILKNGQYAKRQMTWFKKEKKVNWFDTTVQTYLKKVERLVTLWYD